MQYKTIILELLQQNPELKASLLHNSSLTSILDYYGIQLRENHLAIMHQMQSEQPQISELMISSEHGIAAGDLAWNHKDPFDRMLVAQAQLERLILVTSDSVIAQSGLVQVLW